jgi:TPR repeat protein
MFELGNEYIKGNLIEKNYELAYAWHRQACRNGYFLSYV